MSFEKELTDNFEVDFLVGSRLERGRYERYQFDFIFLICQLFVIIYFQINNK